MEGQADEPINSKAGATGGGVARVSNMSLIGVTALMVYNDLFAFARAS
jgi:hypothetical protein